MSDPQLPDSTMTSSGAPAGAALPVGLSAHHASQDIIVVVLPVGHSLNAENIQHLKQVFDDLVRQMISAIGPAASARG